MGFADRARGKAEELAKQAKPAAEKARVRAGELAKQAGPAAERARERAKPAAKQAVEKAKPLAAKLRETAEGFRDGLQGVEHPKPMPGSPKADRPTHTEPADRPRPRPGAD
jgi:uncharacterized protein YjbJ (UPF0337 family)